MEDIEMTEKNKVHLAFLLVFCIGGTIVMSGEKNLLKNSGFEIDIDRDGTPNGWIVEGEKKFIRFHKETFHNGRRSLKVVASDIPTGVYQFISHNGKTKLYKISIWMKTNLVDTTKAYVGIDYYSEDKWFREEVPGAGTSRPRMGLLPTHRKNWLEKIFKRFFTRNF